jgi:hypothetical protein
LIDGCGALEFLALRQVALMTATLGRRCRLVRCFIFVLFSFLRCALHCGTALHTEY